MRLHPRAVRTLRLLAWLVPVLCVPAALAAAGLDQLPDRHPKDESEYRRFVLDNGLRVLLLSDRKLNVSSASLVVETGSLDNPEDRAGLAHFLEHMLFLGTEKFPDVADFDAYLKRNNGYNNAYTAGDHTNYHFEIRHEALEGALDRFSQFFIAPLYTQAYTDREVNAVHSEHQKNLENDNWRAWYLRSQYYREGHPERKFGTGNRDTLAGIRREEFIDFHEKFYSSHRMALAISGNQSLDEMEAWARTYFAAVPRTEAADVDYPADFLPEADAFRVIRQEPIRDLRRLMLEFAVPPGRAGFESKTGELVGFIIGDEGPGSLLSRLKAEGLATGLGASANDGSRDHAAFIVQVELTPLGLERWTDVVERFFSLVAELKAKGYPETIFEERAVMARLDELYDDKGEGSGRTLALANSALFHPLEVAERVGYLWTKPDPEAYAAFVAALDPRRMIVHLMGKGLEVDTTEPIYGTRFSFREEGGEAFARVLAAQPIPEIRIPAPNPYIPSRVVQLAERPVLVVDEPGLSLYYLQDTEFLRPQATYRFRFRLPRALADLRNSVLLKFYDACLGEVVNEQTYTASTAGLVFSTAVALEGIDLSVSGYDQGATRLLDTVTGAALAPALDEERFAAVKDRIVRSLENFRQADAYLVAGARQTAVRREVAFMPEEELPIAREVTMADVLAFARELFRAGRLEALVHGNVDSVEAVATTRNLAARLGYEPIAVESVQERRILVQDAGESIHDVLTLDTNNSGFRREVRFGDMRDPETRAAALVLGNFIQTPFYVEMRTNQQLGYIAFGGVSADENEAFAVYILQSADYPADELARRVDAFIPTLLERFDALSDEELADLVAGARAELEKKETSIAEKAGSLFDRAYRFGGDWDRRVATLASLGSLDRAMLRERLAAIVDPASSSARTVLAYARQHEPAANAPAPSFTNRPTFKSTRVYR